MKELLSLMIGKLNGKAPNIVWGIVIGALATIGWARFDGVMRKQDELQAELAAIRQDIKGMSASFDGFTMNDMRDRQNRALDIEKFQAGLRLVNYRLDLCHGCPSRPYSGGD